MVLGGLVLLIFIPRDPWPVGIYIYLYICAIVGCIVGHFRNKTVLKSFELSLGIGTILFFLGTTIANFYSKSIQDTGEFIMWMPMLLFFDCLNAFAATLTVFPLVGSIINWKNISQNA